MLVLGQAVMVVDLMTTIYMKVIGRTNLYVHLARVNHLFYPAIGLDYFIDFV